MQPNAQHLTSDQNTNFPSVTSQSYIRTDYLKSHLHLQSIYPKVSIKASKSYTWRIRNWNELGTSEYSPGFKAGSFTWKIQLFPKGKDVSSVSIFLKAIPPHSTSAEECEPAVENDWSVRGLFVLAMWNPDNSKRIPLKTGNHRFTQEEPDAGFNSFVELNDLQHPINPDGSPLISLNGSVNISVYLCVLNNPICTLWRDARSYGPTEATKYTGLVHNDSAFHLRSFIQSLYFIKPYRFVIDQIPTYSHMYNVPRALQDIFSELDTSEKPVETHFFTQALHRDSTLKVTQRCVSNFICVFITLFVRFTKGTPVDGVLQNLFIGRIRRDIECINVPLEISHEQKYCVFGLNVKGFKNLNEAFNGSIQFKTLQGKNGYMTRQYGLQKAKARSSFLSFPPVFFIQPERYEFDHQTSEPGQIDNSFEFPADINLFSYLHQEANIPKDDCEYTLYSVIVNSSDSVKDGSLAFVKPTKDGPWYRFYDEQVTRATKEQVFDENFGGCESSQRNSSAYMLVYIRKSMVDQILSENPTLHSILPFRSLKELEASRGTSDLELQNNYITINIRSVVRQFEYDMYFDISIIKDENGDNEIIYNVREDPDSLCVLKSTTVAELIACIQKKWYQKFHVGAMRLRPMTKKHFVNYQFGHVITNSTKPIDQIDEFSSGEPIFNFFLDIAGSTKIDPKYHDQGYFFNGDQSSGKRMFLFLRHFDPHHQAFARTISAILYENSDTLALVPIILKTMGWDVNTRINIWKETEPLVFKRVAINKTAGANGLADGINLVFERVLSPQFIEDNLYPPGAKTVTEYYHFLLNYIKVTFTRQAYFNEINELFSKFPIHDSKDITTFIDRNYTAEQVEEILCYFIKGRQHDIQLFLIGPRRISDRSINHIVRPVSYYIKDPIYSNIRFYYDHSNICKFLFDTQDLFELVWLYEEMHAYQYRLFEAFGENTSLFSYRHTLQSRRLVTHKQVDEVNMWSVVNHRIQSQLKWTDKFASLRDKMICFALYTPEERDPYLDHKSSIRIIEVFHFHENIDRAHSMPFRFAVIRGEWFGRTMIRLQNTLGMNNAEFRKVKFAIVGGSTYTYSIGEDSDDDSPSYTDMADSSTEPETDDDMSSYFDVISTDTETSTRDDETSIRYINLEFPETNRIPPQDHYRIPTTRLDYSVQLFHVMRTTDALGLDYDGKKYEKRLTRPQMIYIKD